MSLLDKFSAVEIKVDSRISEEDRDFCQKHQKDIYFVTYAGSIESNLMQMVMAKEKLNLFMKGQDADLDEIYDKFGVDYNLLSLLMRREADSEGKLHIRWGEQNIA